ncbi:hypothetical protein FRB93_001544 [Tulasnella sp. JGI-2019a]|nr:hypothetical protein FRB93_001544 [Tulasnella sp. JGI-2019a]
MLLSKWPQISRQLAHPLITRSLVSSSKSVTSTNPKRKDRINYNKSSILSTDDDSKHLSYKRVTAADLATMQKPPRQVKMLVRDFIHDSLYNPNYGYFPKNAVIFSADEPIDFHGLKDLPHFQDAVARKYRDEGGAEFTEPGPGKQVWHTPTELFKASLKSIILGLYLKLTRYSIYFIAQPWYGQAMARCLVNDYMLRYFPYEDFVIYELGAGNGTLAQNVLDYVRDHHPEVYERTSYRIIEISRSLADLQTARLRVAHPSIEVIHKSIFDWDVRVPGPCYFMAMEVIDNFPHDVLRYKLEDLKPYQALVAVDEDGDFSEIYEPINDPLISQFLQYRSEIQQIPPALSSPLYSSPALRSLYRAMPFSPNLTPKPEFIPTQLLSFLKVLREYFPRHRLLLSDFSSLPDTVAGFEAPVVQTRYRGTMVPVETFMVQQGYFDIFFPTSFELLRDMYELVMDKPISTLALPGSRSKQENIEEQEAGACLRLGSNFFIPHGRRILDGPGGGIELEGQETPQIFTHQDFMRAYADLDATRLRNGENPLLDYYQNFKVLF